jgi:dolichol kinase
VSDWTEAVRRAIVAPTGPVDWRLEVLHALFVAAAFLSVFAIAEVWKRRFAPPGELTRKFIHFAGGVVVLTFPWLFRSHWSVLALGALSLGVMLLGRRLGFLSSLHDVDRRTKGEVHYAIAVYLLFVVARHQPVFYGISLFALVGSDALAALLGKTYGRWMYAVEAGRKSWEGSAVFFLVTFLGVHLPLLLLTDLDRGHCVIVALQVALLVTSMEAISLYGNDNLIVPLATYYLLMKMSRNSPAGLGLQLGAQLALLAVAGLVAWRSRVLSASGAIAIHLVLYAAFSLGGPSWTVAPALALAGLLMLDPNALKPPSEPERRYQVLAVFYLSIVAVMMLFADNTFLTLVHGAASFKRGHPFFVPFVAALAAQVAVMGSLYLRSHRGSRRWPAWLTASVAAAIGWTAIAPLSLLFVTKGVTAPAALVTAAVCAIATVLYAAGRRLPGWPKGPLWDLRLQTLSVAAAVLGSLPIHLRWIGAL